jgi:hypothetical protein
MWLQNRRSFDFAQDDRFVAGAKSEMRKFFPFDRLSVRMTIQMNNWLH